MIISTHLVEDVAAACGEVTLLDAGQVAFCGTPAELSDLGGAAGPDDENSSASDLERGYLTALHNARERTALCPGT